MYLSNTVWASFGDSSVLCKETISIASHCFYSWFLANTHNMNCTEFRASLSITRNQNNNSHHYLYFLLFWQQFTWGNGTLRSLFCYCLFFFFLVVEKLGNICPCCNHWEFASGLNGAIISQNVSALKPYPANRYTSTDIYACGKRQQVTHRRCSLWADYSKTLHFESTCGRGNQYFPSNYHPSTRSESIKYFNCNLDLE